MMNEQCGPRSRTLCVAFIHIFVSCYFQSVLPHGYINKGGLWLRLSVDLSISLLPKISSLKVLTLASQSKLSHHVFKTHLHRTFISCPCAPSKSIPKLVDSFLEHLE